MNARTADLLSKMTLEEKTCQMATLYGWRRILKDSLPNESWKSAIWKDGIANIDEHLNGFTGFNKPALQTEVVANMEKHVWGMNETQRFFIEQTRLGIPVDFTDEGIRGIEAYEATAFPTALNMGMTWNKELVHQEGIITGREARALGYTNVYAPILDVARDQRWGRLEETYGEDPFLVAAMGTALAKGIQHNGQAASTAKHFAVYSANKGAREGQARTDPQVAPREVENILLYPFKKVIKEAGIMGVMSSYNDYDGIPVSGSNYWLIQRLRIEMGFTGYVVSDSDALEYLSTKHHVAANLKESVYQAFMAGMNVRTTFRPPDSIIIYLRQLVKEGRIPMDTINKRVADVLRVKFDQELGQAVPAVLPWSAARCGKCRACSRQCARMWSRSWCRSATSRRRFWWPMALAANRSEPELGSLIPIEKQTSPRQIRGRISSLIRSGAYLISTGPLLAVGDEEAACRCIGDAHLLGHHITFEEGAASWPPYFFGQVMPDPAAFTDAAAEARTSVSSVCGPVWVECALGDFVGEKSADFLAQLLAFRRQADGIETQSGGHENCSRSRACCVPMRSERGPSLLF